MYDNSENTQSNQGDVSPEPSSQKAPATSTLSRCAKCGTKFDRSASRWMPFCSVRCQRIDLGMWLNESYGLPWDGEGEREELQD